MKEKESMNHSKEQNECKETIPEESQVEDLSKTLNNLKIFKKPEKDMGKDRNKIYEQSESRDPESISEAEM